jgi:hypothetical protein
MGCEASVRPVTDAALVIRRAELPVAADAVAALRAFYAGWGAAGLSLPAGSGEIVFVPAASGQPFHHFALLVPGDRFEAARSWLSARAPLLGDAGKSETTFDFSDWDALACYVADPAGNIVELIAHAELCRSGRTGPFQCSEVCAISEVGLVVDERTEALERLAGQGISLWSGSAGPGGLSFVGRKGHTLILVAPGRGWLPTGAPARRCAATVLVERGDRAVSVSVADGSLTAD